MLLHIESITVMSPVRACGVQNVIVVLDLIFSLEKLHSEPLGGMPGNMAVHQPRLQIISTEEITRSRGPTPGLLVFIAITR